MHYFLEYTLCFIELLIFFKFLSYLFEKRFSNSINIFLIIFFAFIDVSVSIIFAYSLANILLLLILYLYSIITFRCKLFKSFLITTLFYLFEGLISIMTINMFSVIYNQNISILMDNTGIRYLCGFTNKAISSLPLILFRKKFSNILDPKIDKRYNIILFLSAFSLLICVFIGYDISMQNVEVYVKIVMIILINILGVSLLLICILNFMHTKALVKLAEFEILNRNRMLLDEWYSEVKYNQEEISKIRHDIKNTLNSIKTLIFYDNKNAAIELINEITDAGGLNTTIRWTNNDLFDSIVYRKLYRNKDIVFEINTGLLPDYLTNLDTSLLFSNLIDNSLESIDKSAEKKIGIHFDFNPIGYTIRIVNSTNNENIDFMKTSKADIRNHGYGMKVINGIIAKYRGHIVFSVNNGCVEIFIQFPSDFYD